MTSNESVIDMNVQFGTQSVNYFYRQGRLTEEQYNQVSSVIKSLRNVIQDSQKNYNVLNQTMRVLKKDLSTIKHQYQASSLRQAQTTESTQKLSRALKSAQVAYDSQRASYQNQFFMAEELEKEVINRQQKMRDDFRVAEQKMAPMMEKYNAEIQQTKMLNQKTTSNIENLQRMLQENMQKINKLKDKNRQLVETEEKLKEDELKIKDSPDHYAKSAQNLYIQIVGMNSELNDIKQQIARKTKICNTFEEKKGLQKKEIERLRKEKEKEREEEQNIATNIQKTKNDINCQQSERNNLKVQVMNIEKSIQDYKRDIKYVNERVNERKKQIDRIKKQIKKEETSKRQNSEIIIENEMIIEKLRKQQVLIHNEMRGQGTQQETIQEDIAILAVKNETLQQKGIKSEGKKKQIEKQIKKMEDNLQNLKRLVSNILKEIKQSTAVRQSMARKASVATNQVRQTREQLKVKELLILDLSKKYQETENKLQHFKALYEEVKSARNKYVNLIQNSSQDLAELKERIKILQNQLQILKNESAQKNKTIQDYNHMLQIQIHKRDQTKAKLNQFDLEKRKKKEVVDQNINEIQKLNMIILSLQKDMQNLRVQYEDACENRNYTGIQLIDRNDELCILYEKSNIQENILRKSQIAVKGLEDQIRMIKIQIAEMERKIKVAQQRLTHVPKLANKVLQLQEEIQYVHSRENDLSKELEDPQNLKRWRQLKGQDPDEEALDAKISVLEERLNSKKEQLLEKELILDEVTNLSEKLKKDAVDGRQSTLQVSQKINEFQSRLRDLTRKMKATISQLSMCQASIIKFQNQRDQLEKVHDQARVRMEEGLPPTPETQIQYLKMIRDKKRYEEQRRLRLQRDMMQQNLPPFATKTTAQQRVNSYIPDEIGLPKPYGNNAPFMYQQPGSNMRHFKKPQVKQIQI